MEVIYKAFDGKEFEDDELCKQYELAAKLTTRSYPIFADKDGDIIPVADVVGNQKKGMDIYYIFCKNHDEYKNGNELLEEYGGYSGPRWNTKNKPFNKPCCWWWSNQKDTWVDIEERLEELEKQKTIYEKITELSKGV